jgi:anti-sigma factor RsiW
MNDHINGWLAAYFDDELPEGRARFVRAHLEVCEACRTELASLGRLRQLLGTPPEASDLQPAKRFAGQVGLRLERRQARPIMQRALKAAWGSIPVALLIAWAFMQALLALTLLGGTALDLGLWGDVLIRFDRLSPAGALLWQVAGSAVIGTLLLSWLASWWITQPRDHADAATE